MKTSSILAMLFGLYVLSYFLMCVRVTQSSIHLAVVFTSHSPEYLLNWPIVHKIYCPLQSLDGLVRPSYWSTPPEPVYLLMERGDMEFFEPGPEFKISQPEDEPKGSGKQAPSVESCEVSADKRHLSEQH